MATAEELLAAQAGTDEKICIIDLDTRQINIPKSITALGVESDDNVKHLYFRMPKTYHGTDLSDGFSIRINYINANNDGAYFAPVVVVKTGETNYATDHTTFYWDVERDVVAYKGTVKFNVCLVKAKSKDDPTVVQELNTTVATLPVLEGLEPDMESIQEEPKDYLAQLATAASQYKDIVDNAYNNRESDLNDAYETHYENLQNTAKTLSNNFGPSLRTRANAIVKSAEGSVISINDASDDYLRGLRMFGKSTQVTTTGTNLFSTNLEYGLWVFSLKTKTINNSYVKSVDLVQVTPGKTYCFSGTAITNFQGNLAFYDVNGNYTGDDKQLYGFNTFTVPSDAHYIAFHTQASFVKNLKGTVQLEEGSDATAYEPYSGGVASPSPEWAQPIHSVEDPILYIHRKNLVRANYNKTETYEGMSVVITKGLSEVSLNGTTTKPYGYAIAEGTYLTPGQYTMSVYGLNTTDKAYLMNMTTRTVVCDNVRTNSPVTFDVTEAGIYRIDFTFAKETTYTNTTVKFQIEAGETATEYEPIVPFETVTLNHTLPGIPVTSGGNYTDENGQQWICDEIDFERGVYVQRLKTIILDGSTDESWSPYNNNASQGLSFVYYPPAAGISFQTSLCDKYRNVNGCWGEPYRGQTGIYSDHDTVTGRYFRPPNDSVDSLDAWKVWLEANPLTFMYVLATPIETPLTDTALLAAYSALHSNYPTTTVMNDQGAHMEVTYNADTQTVFENAFRPTDEQVQEAVNEWLSNADALSTRITTISVPASAWKTNSEIQNLHSQVVSIAGITNHSKVDLLPSVEQLAIFHNKDVTFVTENEDGVVTVFAIGDKPTMDYTMQAQITEVSV